MVKDVRGDPIFERRRRPPRLSAAKRKDYLVKYKETVDNITAFRLLVMLPIGIVLHMNFFFIDQYFYPVEAPLFFKIRVVDCLLITIACIPLFFKWGKKISVWVSDFCITLLSWAVILMIFLTDGASNSYYAGVNLTILALLITNGFYLWHSFFTCLAILTAYIIATTSNPVGWDLVKFCFATYFMGSTAFFVLLITKFYRDQHFNAFIRNEALKEDERKLEVLYGMADEKAKIDDLTKIYNRSYFFEILTQKINVCKARGTSFFLIIFDVDHFKGINDTYGHIFGDHVIATVAGGVRNVMRMNSYIGRFGGDEFMLIIDEASTGEFLSRLKEVRQAVRNLKFEYEGKPVTISASFGAARWDSNGMDVTKLIEVADSALLEVKRVQRGGIKYADNAIL